MPATIDNWYINSRCIFSCIALGDEDCVKTWSEIEGEEVHVSPSGSRYILSGDKVYRMSDHWGEVRTVNWGLETSDQIIPPKTSSGLPMVSISGFVTNNRLSAIGVARLADFRRNKW